MLAEIFIVTDSLVIKFLVEMSSSFQKDLQQELLSLRSNIRMLVSLIKMDRTK